MPQIDAFPYLTFESSLVQAEEWYLGEPGRERTLPGLLRDWDPLTDLVFSRTVTFDFPRIFMQCGLKAGAEIVTIASWNSPGTGLKEAGSALVFPHGASRQSVTFAFPVAGSKLAGSIELLTRVLLKKSGKSDSTLAASRKGAILWQDERAMRVEGIGSRFPMEFADFSEHGYPTGAGWRLYWKKDFHAQAMGAVCLLINRQHERLRGIVSGAVHDPQSPVILETIHFTIAREMIVGGLESDDFIEEAPNFPKGSIGEAICLLIKRVFGAEDPESVRQVYRTDPERFDCQLQAALRLFHSPIR